jgi:hypothetical protein
MMINDTDIDLVISDLRMELDRIDRAILVFEKLASEKNSRRRKPSRAVSVRPKRTEASTPTRYSANPS